MRRRICKRNELGRKIDEKSNKDVYRNVPEHEIADMTAGRAELIQSTRKLMES